MEIEDNIEKIKDAIRDLTEEQCKKKATNIAEIIINELNKSN